MYIIILLIIVYIVLDIYNSNKTKKFASQNNYQYFKYYYNLEYNKLQNSKLLTLKCLKNLTRKSSIKASCSNYRYSISKKMSYREIYNKYCGGYKAIIEPSYVRDVDIIVGIPFAAALIDGRIVARRTYMKINIIDGYKTKYILFTGLIPQGFNQYNYSLLLEEANLFGDIVIFDMINTYWNITLLLLSMHKWIIEKYPQIKYFIRCNLDAVFIPTRIKGILHRNYDVIAQFSKFKIQNILRDFSTFFLIEW